MITFILYSVVYFMYCTLFFCIVQKVFFGLYNRKASRQRLTLHDIADIYTHGIRSDFIIASYMTAIPLIVSALSTLIPFINAGTVLSIYNTVISIAVALICVSDTLLYKFWGYKLDSSAFVYLRSLKGTFASVSTTYIVCALTLVVLCAALFFLGAEFITLKYASLQQSRLSEWWEYPCVVFMLAVGTGILFVIIRGLKIRPNNPSVVYYSKNSFFNHWALNPAYNLIYSLSTKDDFKGKFRFYDAKECDEIINPLFPTSGTTQKQLLKTKRPNILLIIWESLGAEFVPSLGGKADVAVNVDRIAKEGIFFTRCTASSFRTDRGLVAILSGVPGQPTTSVIRYTRKLPKLPALPRRLKDEGYTTTAVHGGDLTIMHKSDYYLASGHDRLVSQKDFPASAPKCKWGIQDGYVFDFILDDIVKKTEAGERWFTTFQTLSSHEPFKVPYNRIADDEVANSFAYTDHCFGEFIDKLKKTPAWNDTLVICIADHGFNATNNPASRSEYAHIPLIFIGGAVNHQVKVEELMSQTDLAATLLGQLGLPHDDFTFSRDVLADSYKEKFSFHTFNNGFMLTDERGVTVVDNVSGEAIEGPDEKRERHGRAILQKLYEYLSKV